jgi:CubicO group peptidase (beta-lactamase class C family)
MLQLPSCLDVRCRGGVSATLAAFVAVAVLAAPVAGQVLPRASRPEEVGLSSVGLQRLTAAFDHYVEANRLPGAVVLVARRGKVAYLHAFRAREPGVVVADA